MKTKAQKQKDMKKGEAMLDKSQAVVFVDFSKVKTADLRNLRQDLKAAGNPLFIMKKRLVGLMMKSRNLAFDDRKFKTSVGTVFASNIESATASVYKFFKGLEKEKKIDAPKILGGFDLMRKEEMDAKAVIAIGQLPPREVLLTQLAMMIAAPIKSLLYIMQEKANQNGTKGQ